MENDRNANPVRNADALPKQRELELPNAGQCLIVEVAQANNAPRLGAIKAESMWAGQSFQSAA